MVAQTLDTFRDCLFNEERNLVDFKRLKYNYIDGKLKKLKNLLWIKWGYQMKENVEFIILPWLDLIHLSWFDNFYNSKSFI